MPRIEPRSPAAAQRTQSSQAAQGAPKATAPRAAQAPRTDAAQGAWAPKAGGVRAERFPQVASDAKGLVDAHAGARKARSQMEMVDGSVKVNDAADKLLRNVALELASQLQDRGQQGASDKVMKGLDSFFKQAGPAMGYRLDPERGSMASLEDNGERLGKVMAQLEKLTSQLGKVNAEPVADFQQAYNSHARGQATLQEARFALAFEKAYGATGDEKLISRAQTFFKALPKNVEGQVESRGGSMEPMERSGATAEALKKFTATL